jgi:hypothetical protein
MVFPWTRIQDHGIEKSKAGCRHDSIPIMTQKGETVASGKHFNESSYHSSDAYVNVYLLQSG